MDPQQKLFTYFLTTLRNAGYTVYDGDIPGDDAVYPFIYVGENQMNDIKLKRTIRGEVHQTLHVWHSNTKKRGTVSSIISYIKKICRDLEENSNFLMTSCSTQIIPDNSTAQTYLHGIVDVTFKF